MASSPSSRTVLKRLGDHNTYLSRYRPCHRSAHFEELVCQAFAGLLHLPFYDAANEDTDEDHRVTWQGDASSSARAPGGPDGLASAHDFSLVIEATQKTGTRQCSQEFARCLEHVSQFAQASNIDPSDIHTVFVSTAIHADTYNSVKAYNAGNDLSIVLIEIDQLAAALETCVLAFTSRHLETRRLLQDLLECISSADDVDTFRDRAGRCVKDWQEHVLELEQAAVLAVRSYAAMLKASREHVGVSEILSRLTRDPVVKWYFARVQGGLGPRVIAQSLVQESLAVVVGRLPGGEELFCPVHPIEFASRCARRLEAVEDVSRHA